MNKELEEKIMNILRNYSNPVSIESLVRCICNISKESWEGTPPTNQIYQLGIMTNIITNQMHQYFGELLNSMNVLTNPLVDKKGMH